uniref:BACK domain-containing protein n=1 Tax=Elaeophora elaphi TaxID=1147741 RepID=A0A0R3S658_9BILA
KLKSKKRIGLITIAIIANAIIFIIAVVISTIINITYRWLKMNSFAHFCQMWYGGAERERPRQPLPLDILWVIPGDSRKPYFKDELKYDTLEKEAYLKWSKEVGLKNQVRIVLENGYSCCAPACLLAAYSEVMRKIILSKMSHEQFASGSEITIRLSGIPTITNVGLFNVIAYIQQGQTKFLQTELENVLTAAHDLQVISLVAAICKEMTSRINENTTPPITILHTVSDHRSLVVDTAAMKFHDIVKNPEFIKISFEMLYSLVSSPVINKDEYIMAIYRAILFWLRHNNELIYFAPALLDNVNFKRVINTIQSRREIIQKSMEVPQLGPIVQIFLMDAIYAQFSDHLSMPLPSRFQSSSSSIYTISGAETVSSPSLRAGQIGPTQSILGSYIIPPFDSRSSATPRSITNGTSISVESNHRSTQQQPIGSPHYSRDSMDYQSSTTSTTTHTAQEKTLSDAGSSRQRLWSEVLIYGPTYGSKSGNQSGEMSSLQASTAASAGLPSKSSYDSSPTVVTALSDAAQSGPEYSDSAHSGVVCHDQVRGGHKELARSDPTRGSSSAHNGPIRSGAGRSASALISPVRSGLPLSYSSVVAGVGVPKEEMETAITSSPPLGSVVIRTSSSQESVSSSKRRPKFEQIPLRTEPPKSRKELRKERQARERAEKE